ncbi:hypothetical protein C0993_008748 [Termitomyces sp. T159_Od127]|nr:hypothetical protein C0993_008748 [Termitomyces sp. T159_Od127]
MEPIFTVLPAIRLQYPYWREIATFPEFSLIIDSVDNVTVDEESFAPAMVKLPSLIEHWLENKRAALKQELMAANVCNLLTTTHSSTTDDLDLATAVFRCAGMHYAELSSNPLFGWADAAIHICSSKTMIAPFKEASAVASRLVRLVGLNPGCDGRRYELKGPLFLLLWVSKKPNQTKGLSMASCHLYPFSLVSISVQLTKMSNTGCPWGKSQTSEQTWMAGANVSADPQC